MLPPEFCLSEAIVEGGVKRKDPREHILRGSLCWKQLVCRMAAVCLSGLIYFLKRWGMNSWSPRRQVRNSWAVPGDSLESTLMPSSRS